MHVLIIVSLLTDMFEVENNNNKIFKALLTVHTVSGMKGPFHYKSHSSQMEYVLSSVSFYTKAGEFYHRFWSQRRKV